MEITKPKPSPLTITLTHEEAVALRTCLGSKSRGFFDEHNLMPAYDLWYAIDDVMGDYL